MQCAICGAEADDITPGGFDGIAVRCKTCGEYEVASGALNELLRLGFEEREARLNTAKHDAKSGARPIISSVSQ